MSPYIGILIDSFWEAVGNKVLWALLIGWTIVLVCLAPFGYVSERSFQLTSADIDDRTQLIEKLAKASKGQGPEAGKAIAAKMDEEFLTKVRKAADKEGGPRIRSSELAKELNTAITAEHLYSKDAFPTADRRKRLQPLIESEDTLDENDREELNRELLQLAFPLDLHSPRGEQLWIGYAGFRIGDPLQISRRQIREFLEPLVLQVIIKLGLAILAVFVAIIVTSPIIPDTFRSGSLHLLLSKPISRVWLYLSKFFGGTIFVLVNISFVLLGLYLIAGMRFDIWNSGLLLCIPLLLFVFVIFYSVSGLAGLLWGNAIVCVVSCMVFWFCCFCLGFARGAMQPHIEIYPQITNVNKIGDHLTVVSERGDFSVWNAEFSVWQPGIHNDGPGGPKRTFGPIFDSDHNKILIKSFFRNPFGSPFARNRKLNLVSLDSSPQPSDEQPSDEQVSDEQVSDEQPSDEQPSDEQVSDEQASDEQASDELAGPSEDADAREPTGDAIEELASDQESPNAQDTANETERIGPESDRPAPESKESSDAPKSAADAPKEPRWSSDPGPEIPAQLFGFVQLNDNVIAVCRGGLYRLDMNRLEMIEASEKALLGLFKMPAWASKSAFQNIAPKDYFLTENSSASATQDGDSLIVFSSGNLDLLRLDESGFQVVSSAKLDGKADNTEAALVQMNRNYGVVVRDGLPIQILNHDLEPVSQVDLPDDSKVKQISWIPGTDALSIVTHTGDLLKLECESGSLSPFPLPGAGNATCVRWMDATHVWIGIKPNRVIQVDTAAGQILETYSPTSSVFESIYGWGVNPLYRLLPKPAALDDAMLYVLTGNETQSLNLVTNDLQAAQLELDIWTPILSNLAFVIVMLSISCFYVARKEF